MTDVERARCGDATAYESLLRRHGPNVYSLLARRFGSPLAEDVFQEAAGRMYRNLGRLRDSGSFRAWFVRIAMNEAKKVLRSRQRRDLRQRKWQQTRADATQVSQEARLAAAQMLELGLSRLAPHDRQILMLRFVEELSYAEISGALGVAEFVAKMRVSRARRRFNHEIRRLSVR